VSQTNTLIPSCAIEAKQFPSAQLYNALYDYALTLEKVAELTVEDPSEAFEDLRDRCDLVRLKEQLKDSKEMAKGAPVDKKWLEKIRTEGKYATVRNYPPDLR